MPGNCVPPRSRQPKIRVPGDRWRQPALVSAVGVDDDLSDWIADEQPLFGSDAADTSDTLRDVALASYLVSAVAVPSDTATNKLSDLGVGIATLYAQGALVSGLKEVTRRRRPNYSNRLSLPSGHTATASAASVLAMHNLARIDMPSSMRTTAAVGLEAVVIGTGWGAGGSPQTLRRRCPGGLRRGSLHGRFRAGRLYRSSVCRERKSLSIRLKGVGR